MKPFTKEDENRYFKRIDEGKLDIASLVLQTPAGVKGLMEWAEGLRSGELDPKGIIKDWEVDKDPEKVARFLRVAEAIALGFRKQEAYARKAIPEIKDASPQLMKEMLERKREYISELGALIPTLGLDRNQLHRMVRKFRAWSKEYADNGNAIEGIIDRLGLRDQEELRGLMPRPGAADKAKEAKLRPLRRAFPDLDLMLSDARHALERIAYIQEESGMSPGYLKNVLKQIRARKKQLNGLKRIVVEGKAGLVEPIAKKYLDRGVPLDDLMRAGVFGLGQAVDNFERAKGLGFSGFAVWWIRQALTRAVADAQKPERVHLDMADRINQVRKVAHALLKSLGREPTPAEISEAVGLPLGRLRKLLKSAKDSKGGSGKPRE
ncbi:MAG: hypothetical protein LBF40_01205 [Deltaproteobacteria bacterium]|nr:hypothetical protein [Deltaproteobacteria bacterium]